MNDALHAKVSRLRQILAEAIPAPAEPTQVESDEWRRYQAFAANQPYPAFDDSERARSVRAINRIGISYGWTSEIQRFLDDRGRSSIAALDDAEVEGLADRMRRLENCVQEGCDPPDAPPAR